MAIFNGVTTWIETIVRPRGFTSSDAGTLGALMLVGGICGAILLPALSDKEHKRKKYLFIGLGLAIPGLIGLTFAAGFWSLAISSFALGFFLTSASPISMQFGAEITHPTPEGTSNGLFQLFGQVSVVYVYIMEALQGKDGSFTPGLLLAVALLVICLWVVSRLKDPKPVNKPSTAKSSVLPEAVK